MSQHILRGLTRSGSSPGRWMKFRLIIGSDTEVSPRASGWVSNSIKTKQPQTGPPMQAWSLRASGEWVGSKVLLALSLLSLGRRWIQHWHWQGGARGQSDRVLQLFCRRWFTITEGGLRAGHVTHTDEWTAALFHYQSATGFRKQEGGEQEKAARAGIINSIQTTISLPFPPLEPDSERWPR